MLASSNNNSAAAVADATAADTAANSKQNAPKRFFRSKSSIEQPSASSGGKSDGNKRKKKKKPPNSGGEFIESINFSSASSSGYNSHITPGEINFSHHQHLYHHHHHPQHQHIQQQQQPRSIQQDHHHGGHLASLPAMDSSGFNYGGGREAPPPPPKRQQSWQRSVSLRAPMVPMMIDDELGLIDDDYNGIDGDAMSLTQQQQQHHYPNSNPNHQQQYRHHHRQYQHHQQQFTLADDDEAAASEQCVDSAAHHHQPHSLYLNNRHHQQQQQQQRDNDDDDEQASRYSQVRHRSSCDANQGDDESYIERISHIQQKQQHQLMLASALRHHHQHPHSTDQRSGGLSSKSTFSLVGPHSSNGNSSNGNNSKHPVAIYHQPNLNHQYIAAAAAASSLPYQHQVRDLQRRYLPTPFSQTAAVQRQQHPPSVSGARSLSLASKSRSNTKQLSSGGSSSAGSQSATTDSGGALVGAGHTDQPSSGSSGSNISAITASFAGLRKPTPDNKMQSSGAISSTSGNRSQHSSRIKSPALSQSSGGGGGSSRMKQGSKSSHVSSQQIVGEDGRPQPRLGFCGKIAKLLLFISNILFWSAGIALGAWGIMSLVDDHKYNLSQLLVFEPSSKMSLFQLLSWSFITLGCATILVGFCGCSAIFKNNRWILGLYIFLILAIFALDLATGLLAMIFQERLVANVRLRLANKLRSDYGVQASFTAAIDYIQTKYECCGLEGHFDYDQSLWRLQRLGGFDATVARTCCHLRNTFDDQAHVNPRPVNESMCQSNDVRFHQSYRYRKGCLDDLERLVRHKIWYFTIGCGAVGGVILLSLLFATCFCRSIPSPSGSRKSSQQQLNHQESRKQKGGFILNQQPHHTTNAQQQHQRHYHR